MGKQPLGIELVKRGVVSEADIEKALEWCATRQVDNQKNKSFSTRCHAGYFYVASCSFSL